MKHSQLTNTSHEPDADIRRSLIDNGIKPTRQRMEIAKAIITKPQHFSAEQVFSIVNSDTEHVSKATIYNTLNLFTEKGFIRQVLIDPTRIFYDSSTEAHGHFFNEDTGELSDFCLDKLNINRNQLASLPEDTVLDGIDIIVRVKSIKK